MIKANCSDCGKKIIVATNYGRVILLDAESKEFFVLIDPPEVVELRTGLVPHKCKPRKEDKKFKNGIYCSICKTEFYPENLALSARAKTEVICPECRSKGIITLSWIEK